MKNETITTDQAPAAIGPYSQAVRAGDFIYTAGQGGLDPRTNQMVAGGVQAQAEQTMKNLQAVLEAAGVGFEDVVKTNIYLHFIKDFAVVNEVYASYFSGSPPARSTVAVSALPLKALVEIEMIAYVPQVEEPQGDLQQPPVEKKHPKKKGKKAKKNK